MSDEKKDVPTEEPEKDELKDADLEKVTGGAIDSYLYFDPAPPPTPKHK